MFYAQNQLADAEEAMLNNDISQKVIRWFSDALSALSDWPAETLNNLAKSGISELQVKAKDFYTPLRLALIGQAHGPDLPTTLAILGREESLRRLGASIKPQ